jgi:uncharacterized protein YkwD
MKLSRVWTVVLSVTCAVASVGFAGATIADAFDEPTFGPITRAVEFRSGGFQMAERLQTPTPRPTPPVAATPGTSAGVQAVLDQTNSERTSRGLGPLSLHPQLMQAGDAHFSDQFRQGCSNLSHSGTDGSSPFDRIKATGFTYRTAGENIACGYQTPDAVMNGWMNSSGHRANILNGSFTNVGIVAAPDAFGHMYWMQVFGTLQ